MNLEEEANRFMQGRRQPVSPLDDIIKRLENVNKQLELIFKKVKETSGRRQGI